MVEVEEHSIARERAIVLRELELAIATGGRWHSGLGADQGVATNGVRSADLTLGVRARRGLLSIQPYVRAQAGTLRARSSTLPDVRRSFAGLTGGLVVHNRF